MIQRVPSCAVNNQRLRPSYALPVATCRVDNFTAGPLHVQQAKCEAEDIIRPYSCLPYAWDEPSAPQALVVSLPGQFLHI